MHVTLKTDSIGNQLAPPADVKLRGMIVGEVRNVSSNGAGRQHRRWRCSPDQSA